MGIQTETIIGNICRAYGIDLIDKGEGENKLIISIGSGLLMATMDLFPHYRFAFEYKKDVNNDAYALLNLYINRIVVTAWFSISKPVYLYKSLNNFEVDKIFYQSNYELIGKRFSTLKNLYDNESIFGIESEMVRSD